MPSLAGSGRTGGREAHKMKTLMRHGLAVCLALTTMCTSLLLMYGGIGGGGGGGHPEPRRRQQQQQQVAAEPSRPPGRGQHRPALPVGAGLLEGYISVLEHKVSPPAAGPPLAPGPPCPVLPRGHPARHLQSSPSCPPCGAGSAPGGMGCPAASVSGLASLACSLDVPGCVD
ncbi:PREDICTED: arginine-glutamic acid dipeptide repeats protein-like [Calidris pugnax]|uniref:arginine-glutamic acid dipeptide repeats protein-like n=1 Tax=Calidris pugnax TaxID=198806 RepID=UPI00071C3F9A|nr:PREDICTED: arginine-glutamic acid dipeptide repeats protein-like [Calidris pugnax]